MVAILAGHGRRETENISGFGATGDELETHGRKMMALVDDEMTIVADEIVDFAFSDETLDQGDVDQRLWASSCRRRSRRSASRGRSEKAARRSTH